MRILRFIGFAFIILLSPVYAHSSPFGSLHISLVQGDVQIRGGDISEWVPASINTPLLEGDQLWVPEEGKAEIRFKDGTLLRLNKYSLVEMLSADKNSLKFHMSGGDAYVNFKGDRGSAIQIYTQLMTVRAQDRAVFRIDITGNGYADISVFKGVVYAESRKGETRISEGKSLYLGDDDYAEISYLGRPDSWERWNHERDEESEKRRYSYRYLPGELGVYSRDFDDNGEWIYDREHGHIWKPRVVISAGWSPYRHGRWVWMRGDYVWISYEPWGWAPYHYGRWTFIPMTGWCWVPPVRGAIYWGPGFVGWVHTPEYVAWVPLAPGDIYYGYGYYGPHSLNIVNVRIGNPAIKRVYKNVYINNAVTILHNDTFVKGRQVNFKPGKNPFLLNNISIGRPNIKPEKAAFMPVIREIPHSKRPVYSIEKGRISKNNRMHEESPNVSATINGPDLGARRFRDLKEQGNRVPLKETGRESFRQRQITKYDKPLQERIQEDADRARDEKNRRYADQRSIKRNDSPGFKSPDMQKHVRSLNARNNSADSQKNINSFSTRKRRERSDLKSAGKDRKTMVKTDREEDLHQFGIPGKKMKVGRIGSI
ncbi:MAG: FecR family protein [Nitrospirota bacterium]